jgi:hypothetical protein
MTLQSSGSISLSQISNEFGLPSSRNFGAYRVRETYSALSNIPLDTGVPQSGPIKFSDFYNKKLNIIVDCYSANPSVPLAPFHFDSVDSMGKATRQLYTFKENPFAYPDNAPISSSDFVSRYGVSPLNSRDPAIANNPNISGDYSWNFPSVSFPEDGNYRIKAVVDDGADIRIGSILIHAGFNGQEVDTIISIKAGTYTMEVSFFVLPNIGSIAAGNLNYFALTIDRVIPPSPPAGSLEKVGIKGRYGNNFAYPVGGFRGKPSSTSGCKVIAHVNTLVYNSTKGIINSVALRSGIWDPDTELIINIGPSGAIIGSGGDGAKGANVGEWNPPRAQNGGSAMAILYPCTIINRGYIQRGHGGGGGGGFSSFVDAVAVQRGKKFVIQLIDVAAGGGGGGGGAGYPIGLGGDAGTGGYGVQPNGIPYDTAGERGENGVQALTPPFNIGSTVRGGLGGVGGDRSGPGGNGGPPSRSAGVPGNVGSGSDLGDNGYAFLFFNDGTGITIINVDGGSVYSGGSPGTTYLYNTVGYLY